MTALEIRAARAEDQAAAVPLIHSAGPIAFDYVFGRRGRPSTDFLDFAFASGRGLFGCCNHFVAVRRGQVVATVSLYGATEHKALARALPLQITQFFGVIRAPGVLRRSLQVAAMMPAPGEDVEYLANFGVSPELRSQGIGRRVLQFACGRARERGKQVLALDVVVGNSRAQALYERFGLLVVAERSFGGPQGRVPDTRRMELALA